MPKTASSLLHATQQSMFSLPERADDNLKPYRLMYDSLCYDGHAIFIRVFNYIAG